MIALLLILLAQDVLVHTAHSWGPAYAGPTYVGAGNGNGGTTASRTPQIPTMRQTNDIFVAVCITEATTLDHSYPVGWTEVAEVAGTGHESSWAWRRSDGTESGTITITLTGNSTMSFARIYCFRSATTSGAPYENNGDTTGASTGPTNENTTLSGDNRLALGFVLVEDNIAPGSWTNGWTEDADTGTSAGNDGELALVSKQFTTGTLSGQTTGTLNTSENWTIFGMALKP